MIFMNSFLDQDQSSYNMSMVLIYVLVLTVAFIMAVIISNKLNIYNNRVDKNSGTTINAVNELKMQAMNETAVAAEDIRGTKDEQ